MRIIMLKSAVIFTTLVALCMGHYAVVQIRGNNVHGTLRFTKNEYGLVAIDGEISGLKPGKHGFHVHEYGDISNGCKSAGGHFNPYKYNHGAPTDQERHVGDLGNIVANELGVAYVSIVDKVIDLEGPNNVIGRSVVVHEGEDDLGRGGYDDSLSTGHAGDRAGCGIIEGFHGYY